jgi:hypothetical protein
MPTVFRIRAEPPGPATPFPADLPRRLRTVTEDLPKLAGALFDAPAFQRHSIRSGLSRPRSAAWRGHGTSSPVSFGLPPAPHEFSGMRHRNPYPAPLHAPLSHCRERPPDGARPGTHDMAPRTVRRHPKCRAPAYPAGSRPETITTSGPASVGRQARPARDWPSSLLLRLPGQNAERRDAPEGTSATQGSPPEASWQSPRQSSSGHPASLKTIYTADLQHTAIAALQNFISWPRQGMEFLYLSISLNAMSRALFSIR